MKTTRALSFAPTTSSVPTIPSLLPLRLIAFLALCALLACVPQLAFAEECVVDMGEPTSVEAVGVSCEAGEGTATCESIDFGEGTATGEETEDAESYENADGHTRYPITLTHNHYGIAQLKKTSAEPGECVTIVAHHYGGFSSHLQTISSNVQDLDIRFGGGRDDWYYYFFYMPAEPVSLVVVFDESVTPKTSVGLADTPVEAANAERVSAERATPVATPVARKVGSAKAYEVAALVARYATVAGM